MTPWTGAHQTPLSVGFFRQEYWSGLPFPSPEALPNPGTEPTSPGLNRTAREVPDSFMFNVADCISPFRDTSGDGRFEFYLSQAV